MEASMLMLIVMTAVRMIDPIVILCGVVPYFAQRGDWRVGLGAAAGVGALLGVLMQALIARPGDPLLVLGWLSYPLATSGWWAICHFVAMLKRMDRTQSGDTSGHDQI
jgi:hypothetical protein